MRRDWRDNTVTFKAFNVAIVGVVVFVILLGMAFISWRWPRPNPAPAPTPTAPAPRLIEVTGLVDACWTGKVVHVYLSRADEVPIQPQVSEVKAGGQVRFWAEATTYLLAEAFHSYAEGGQLKQEMVGWRYQVAIVAGQPLDLRMGKTCGCVTPTPPCKGCR